MAGQRIDVRELVDQLHAEAVFVSASGLDEERRDRLTAIRRRIDELRLSLGLTNT